MVDSPRIRRAIEVLRACVSQGMTGEFVVNLSHGRIKHLWVNRVDLLEGVPENGTTEEERVPSAKT